VGAQVPKAQKLKRRDRSRRACNTEGARKV